jgi:hypothetical protein
MTKHKTSEAGKELSKLGASKGGEARARNLTSERRREIARKAVQARWAKAKGYEIPENNAADEKAITDVESLPVAKHKGFLNIMDVEIPCYVLDNGQRVIGRVAATEMLSGFKYQGDLEGYLRSQNLKPFIDKDMVVARMVSFLFACRKLSNLGVK